MLGVLPIQCFELSENCQQYQLFTLNYSDYVYTRTYVRNFVQLSNVSSIYSIIKQPSFWYVYIIHPYDVSSWCIYIEVDATYNYSSNSMQYVMCIQTLHLQQYSVKATFSIATLNVALSPIYITHTICIRCFYCTFLHHPPVRKCLFVHNNIVNVEIKVHRVQFVCKLNGNFQVQRKGCILLMFFFWEAKKNHVVSFLFLFSLCVLIFHI